MPESISSISPQQFAAQQAPADQVPTDIVPLPSEGKAYPPNHPLAGKDSLEIRSMTARDEDILTSRALIIAIRITGYGSEYPIKFSCPSCSAEVKHTVELGELPIKRFPAELWSTVAAHTNEVPFLLPVSKKSCTFRLLTGQDESELLQIMDRGRKLGIQDELVTTRLRMQITSIGSERDPAKLV